MWPCYLRYPAAGCPALLPTQLQVTQGLPRLIRCQPRLGDLAGDLYQQTCRPTRMLTRGPVVVTAELVCPRGVLDLLGKCHRHLLGPGENRDKTTRPGRQRSRLDASAAP